MTSLTRLLPLGALVLVAGSVACHGTDPAESAGLSTPSPQPSSTPGVLRAETVVRGLENPWGLDFLPDGRMIITERPGRLRIAASDGTLGAPVAGVPAVYARGQGGLLDVALDPDFANNQFVYLTYAEPEGDKAGTSAARGRLVGNTLTDVQVIYRQQPKYEGGGHYGSRIVFANDGTLFITQGDRMNHREKAQDLRETLGKVVRITPDGRVPADNPFVGRDGVRPEIWSYGHRNMQGATRHPVTGSLWTIEHGARGGDELNHPEAGRNYGWPVITYGRDYSGFRIGEGVAKEGMEQPVYYWDPVIAPSGMTFYTGGKYDGMTGDLFIGSLSPGGLVRLTMQDGQVVRETRYLGELRERIRDVVQGPDGFLYLLTDSRDGRVLRVVPEAGR